MKLKLLLASLSVASVLGAAEFPAAVDGVITLDVASGSTTYDAALPSATKLVKTGAGEAILTAATTAFTGSVEIREGMLTLKDRAAVGSNTPISVTGDAATLNCNFARPDNSNQWTCFFSGHNVTIRGKGVDGKGAFRYTALDSNVCDDSMLESLTLSDDAYIGIPSRWGIKKALNLNGHTLTRIDGTGTWMWFSSEATIDAGVISNVVGAITPQNVPKFTDPEKTTIYMAGGKLGFWYARPAISCRVVMCGGTFEGGGSGAHNILSGPVDFTKDIWIGTGLAAGSFLEFTGQTTVDSSVTNFQWGSSGSLYLNGPVSFASAATGLWIWGTGRMVCSSNVTRCVGRLLTLEKSRVDLEAGTLECRDFIRISHYGNARTGIFQSGGDFSVANDSIFGEIGGSCGVYQMAGGTATFKNSVYVSPSTTSEGLIVQTGGTMRVVCNGDWARVRMQAGRALIAVLDNATNDTRAVRYGNSERLRLGYADSKGGGRGTLAVCGAHAVATTESLVMGTGNYATTNLVVVADGGTLKARRFYCEPGQHAEAWSPALGTDPICVGDRPPNASCFVDLG